MTKKNTSIKKGSNKKKDPKVDLSKEASEKGGGNCSAPRFDRTTTPPKG
ncbi:MAG: hypothetical protein KJO00_12195 [Bacteroidia bacterium]|nr:hypothetical protein [Bacteroidia bacterium]MBT8288774.1 hypothetical protein [Bacteroidia bacterium]